MNSTTLKTTGEGKLKLNISIKKRPDFENYLDIENPKFRQSMSLPKETERYNNKA